MTRESVAPKLSPEHVRVPDPNVAQRKASDPEISAWVSASAGTGKTKVLTDRILRLMLPQSDGRPGAPPQRILAITFTKAGASVMRQRINTILGRWAVLPPDELKETLAVLLARTPTRIDTESARRLFAEVVDIPGGLKIMTIHAFCQSILSRFPLEAGLPPYFAVLDEGEAALLLSRARETVLARAQADKTTPEGQALGAVAQAVGEDQFVSLLTDIIAERAQLARIMLQHFGPDGLYTAICKTLGIKPGEGPETLLLQACEDSAFDHAGMQKAMTALLAGGGKTDTASGEKIAAWLERSPSGRVALFETYKTVFFTAESEFRKNFATQSVAKAAPHALETLSREAERLRALSEQINAAGCALLTRELMILGQAIIRGYQDLKTARAALDFDDLIFMTLDLLEGRSTGSAPGQATGWVLYKLDQGLDHILIDEAQDTNPEQWKIIKALCDDFFAGTGAHEQQRTVFTVGDEKQSIYSFQRASPEEFARMHDDFEQRIQEANSRFENVLMNISFRSSRSVLQAVDTTFAQPGMATGMGGKDIRHHPFQTWRGGRVELWPLCETTRNEDEDYWAPPVNIIESTTGAAQLAGHIATTIKGWLDSGEILPSLGRPIQAGDIMILVHTRTAFFGQLVKALKTNNTPVSGVDRMVIGEQLPVQDMLATAAFALMPGDDLTLATLLKSPFIGISEDELFELAYGRHEGKTLWEALKPGLVKAWLQNLINNARTAQPYEFFSNMLNRPCPGDETSGWRAVRSRLGPEAIDPIDELLSAALGPAGAVSLQEFLHQQERQHVEVKREMSEAGAELRIMTVHASKGLEAPIVILPDTVRSQRTAPSQAGRRLLWPEKTGLTFPLWSPRASSDFPLYEEAARTLDERADEEYKRLLYVAMTRAQDRLYICGYKGKKALLPTSWYNYIQDGLRSLPETEIIEDGRLVLENKQTREPKPTLDKNIPTGMNAEIPEWLHQIAQNEKAEKNITPSHISETDQPVFSLSSNENAYRFKRGNLVHKLLEFVPSLPTQDRPAAIERFLKLYAGEMNAVKQREIVTATLAVLNQPDFAPIFGPGSQAEVPLAGRLPDGRLVSGQIDRLLITDSEIRIIDYKTGAIPASQHTVPAQYTRQMQAYADILRQIYPQRRIQAALLWTDGPALMPVDVG